MAAKRPPLPPSDVPMRKRCYRSGLSVKLGDLQLHRVSSRPELTFGPSKDVTETLLKYRPDCIYRHILNHLHRTDEATRILSAGGIHRRSH
jgi:hypothetical protein